MTGQAWGSSLTLAVSLGSVCCHGGMIQSGLEFNILYNKFNAKRNGNGGMGGLITISGREE